MEKTIKPPKAKKIANINIPKVEKLLIFKEIPTFVLSHPDTDIITVDITFESGKWHEPKLGTAYLTTKMLKEGTKTKDYNTINEKIDYYGASIKTSCDLDNTTIKLTTLNNYFNKVFPILREVILEPIFPANSLVKVKQLETQYIKLYESKNKYIASRKLKESIFGPQHPYGSHIKKEAIQELTNEELKEYYQNKLLKKPQIFIAGNVTQEVVDTIQNQLKPLDKKTNQIITHKVTPQEKKHHIQKNESPLQSSILIGKETITKNHPDFINLYIINQILGGYFGSRLMTNLREEKGYTYGVHSYIETYKHSSCLVIATEVIAQHQEDACTQIYKEIKKLQQSHIKNNELDRVKKYLLGSTIIQMDSPLDYMTYFKKNKLLEVNEKYYKKFYETVQSISKEIIIELANKYLSINDFSQVTVS